MISNNLDWSNMIRKLPGWITGFIAFVSAIVGFIKLVQGNTDLVTVVLITIGASGGMLGCALLAFTRANAQVIGSQYRPWKYPRLRPWALISLAIIPLISAGGLGYRLYQQAQPPDHIIILVADFDGPEPEKYRVTEAILHGLSETIGIYSDVRIESLGRAITTAEGSAVALTEGQRHKATIVIWGWYGTTEIDVPVSVHFEILHPLTTPDELRLGQDAKGDIRLFPKDELESFTLQSQLSEEMAFLSLFTVGMSDYVKGDWPSAINHFNIALSNRTLEYTLASDQSVVYFYRGKAHLHQGNQDQAVVDFQQVLALSDDPDFRELAEIQLATLQAK